MQSLVFTCKEIYILHLRGFATQQPLVYAARRWSSSARRTEKNPECSRFAFADLGNEEILSATSVVNCSLILNLLIDLRWPCLVRVKPGTNIEDKAESSVIASSSWRQFPEVVCDKRDVGVVRFRTSHRNDPVGRPLYCSR